MKSILMSIKPKYVAKILNKEKTIEVRKRFPLDYRGWVYIYCTKEDSLIKLQERYKDRYICEQEFRCDDFPKMYSGYEGKGKVVARFYCDKVEEIRTHTITITNTYGVQRNEITNDTQSLNKTQLLKSSCLNSEQLNNYLDTVWWNGKTLICGYAIHISQLEIFDIPKELSEFKQLVSCPKNLCETCIKGQCKYLKSLTKAPQSWQYVEVER